MDFKIGDRVTTADRGGVAEVVELWLAGELVRLRWPGEQVADSWHAVEDVALID